MDLQLLMLVTERTGSCFGKVDYYFGVGGFGCWLRLDPRVRLLGQNLLLLLVLLFAVAACEAAVLYLEVLG